jgi:hypothetical protein
MGTHVSGAASGQSHAAATVKTDNSASSDNADTVVFSLEDAYTKQPIVSSTAQKKETVIASPESIHRKLLEKLTPQNLFYEAEDKKEAPKEHQKINTVDFVENEQAKIYDLKERGELSQAKAKVSELEKLATNTSDVKLKSNLEETVKTLTEEINKAMLEKYQKHFTEPKVQEAIKQLIDSGLVTEADLKLIDEAKDDATKKRVIAQVLQKILSDPKASAELKKDIGEIVEKLKKEGKEASTGNVLDSMGRSKNSIKNLVGERNLLALYRTHVFAQMEEFEKQRKQVEKMNDEQVKNQLKAKEDNDEKRSRQIQDSNRAEANRQEAKRIEHIKTKLASKVGAYKASLLLMYAPDGNISFEVLKSLGLTGVINLIEEGMLLVDQNVEKYLIKNASLDEQKRHLPKSTLDVLLKEQKVS